MSVLDALATITADKPTVGFALFRAYQDKLDRERKKELFAKIIDESGLDISKPNMKAIVGLASGGLIDPEDAMRLMLSLQNYRVQWATAMTLKELNKARTDYYNTLQEEAKLRASLERERAGMLEESAKQKNVDFVNTYVDKFYKPYEDMAIRYMQNILNASLVDARASRNIMELIKKRLKEKGRITADDLLDVTSDDLKRKLLAAGQVYNVIERSKVNAYAIAGNIALSGDSVDFSKIPDIVTTSLAKEVMRYGESLAKRNWYLDSMSKTEIARRTLNDIKDAFHVILGDGFGSIFSEDTDILGVDGFIPDSEIDREADKEMGTGLKGVYNWLINNNTEVGNKVRGVVSQTITKTP